MKTWTKLVVILSAVFMLVCIGLAAQAADPIVLGAPLSTGYLHGWDAEKGIKLAVDEINQAGGVSVGGVKRPLRVEVIDTRDQEPGVPVSEALQAVEKLILEKKADFLVGGPVRSEAALAAMPLVAKYKKISIVSTGVLTPKFSALVAESHDKYKYFFRIHGEVKWVVNEIVTQLMEIKERFKLDKILIMVQDVAHARTSGQILKKAIEPKGWTVAGLEVFPTGAGDFSMGLTKAQKTGAQVLSIWMDMPESSILLRQWFEMKVPALPFGSTLSAAEQPGFWKATEGKGEYCMANVINAGNAPSDATPWTMKFYNDYEKKYGLPPEGLGASSSYMAVYVLKDAIERAGTLDSDKVILELEKTDIMGVYGRLRFDPRNHQVIPALDPKEGAVGSIFQWQNGQRVVVFPKSIAKGEIKLPPWMKQ
ncbi:MAG: ABC transporter substrate-binding protein [Proteobacteria bacterium]|nr:ABC transporter substrate-binding protein [Pseudomonadota bacterium]